MLWLLKSPLRAATSDRPRSGSVLSKLVRKIQSQFTNIRPFSSKKVCNHIICTLSIVLVVLYWWAFNILKVA